MRRHTFDEYIRQANFINFFNELGWNHVSKGDRINPVKVEETDYEIIPVADKQGFKVLTCQVDELPQHSTRKKIDLQLRKYFHYYILIFVSEEREHQLWMVPVKTVDKRDIVVIEYQGVDKADFLFSKIPEFSFDLEEETNIIDVTLKVHHAFEVNSERVTKDFYAGFRKQHNSFVKFIEGIQVENDRQWYASVMLNRLMFCYFIQKKGFLNFDYDYLRNKLKWTQEQRGENQFFGTFYKGFLSQLFHGGLNEPKHGDDFKKIYGRIPYLNGGLFDRHQLEEQYEGIDIPDTAFENLFDFFDRWRWHLDTRITATGKDINPDVLGYIFEQYINDRAQMGAYYTKEDITEYIGKNCIVPFLMDEVAKSPSKKHFTPGGYVWERLRNSGDTYIYDAVKKGMEIKELPEEIAIGIDTIKPALLERRAAWNKPTPGIYALPTEIWRETIERRKHYTEILEKIRRGEIRDINDFITYNLDIRRFVEDLLLHTDDHLFILHFYKALQNITILDPTCGSGAFLFAALNILEPLYETCIIRMQEFNAKNKALFKDQLEEIEKKYRSNIQYFIYKSIILRNLYGVDIMHEATEIARLRLFLKMVAVVDVDRRADNLGLDPLPDIDFNIRCGNTLVGYATQQELDKDLTYGDMFANMEFKEKVEQEMQKVAMAYKRFKEIQFTQHEDMTTFKQAKTELNARLNVLNQMLNKRLYTATVSSIKYEEWIKTHQPFHWLAEFYEIMQQNRGFDVIIGNPPYVALTEIKYNLTNYKTISCGDIYALCLERSATELLLRSGRIGMIVPISIVSTDGYKSLRSVMGEGFYHANFGVRPSKLFDGVDKRLTIILSNREKNRNYTTKYYRWTSEERENLFSKISFQISNDNTFCISGYPKTSSIIERDILEKLEKRPPVSAYLVKYSQSKIRYTRKLQYFIQFFEEPPIILNERDEVLKPTELKEINIINDKTRYILICTLNSNLFFWFFIAFSDCRNVNLREIINFPVEVENVNEAMLKQYRLLADELMIDFKKNAVFQTRNDKRAGTLQIQSYQPRLSKPIIDEIDKVLARHYGFTEEELDFIINYDIKYRMGSELNGEE